MSQLLAAILTTARELSRPLDLWDLAILGAAGAVAAVVDARELRIPDSVLIAAGVALVLKWLVLGPAFTWWVLAEAALGGGYFLLFWWASGGRVGLGDAKLSALLAAGLGLAAWLAAVVVASLTAIAWALGAAAAGRRPLADPIPLAPFLLLGTIAGWWLTRQLV